MALDASRQQQGAKVWELQNCLRGPPLSKTPKQTPDKNSLCISAETNKDQQVQTWRQDSPLVLQTGIPPAWVWHRQACLGCLPAAGKQKSFSSATAAAPGTLITALAGVSILLVAHQWAVVMQDLHGMFPVPAGATEVFEADLGRGMGEKKAEMNVPDWCLRRFYWRLIHNTDSPKQWFNEPTHLTVWSSAENASTRQYPLWFCSRPYRGHLKPWILGTSF